MKTITKILAILLFPVLLCAGDSHVSMTVVDIKGDSIGYYKVYVEMDGIVTAIDTSENMIVVNNGMMWTAPDSGYVLDSLITNESMIYNSRGDHPWYRATFSHSTFTGGSGMLRFFMDSDSTIFDLGTKTDAVQFTH